MKNLGELLKELRGSRPLREVSKRTGLSHTYISDLEKGYKHGTKVPINPSPDTLKRLANAYNYSYRKLLERAGYIDEGDTEVNSGCVNFENLTEEEKDYLKLQLEIFRKMKEKDGKNLNRNK
ncbi:helix-turn-helix domain-containing protein [Pseudalkalibacillus sp. R45]|uniref:helix-turn-helix domain-containing protein n=1 Tax=Pseudalkalibacillus sp. R45 TaxID=3457433 RepID=UPI003FCE6B25